MNEAEIKKLSPEDLKAAIAAGDVCYSCHRRAATVGAHGVRNKQIYDEYTCAICYIKADGQISHKDVERLSVK